MKKEHTFLRRIKPEYVVKKEKTAPSELMVRALLCDVVASDESMSLSTLQLFAIW